MENIAPEWLRRGNLNSKRTLKVKSLVKFVKSKNNKYNMYVNNLIDELKQSGYYDKIYNDFNDKDYKDKLGLKDIEILELLDFVEPDELDSKYKGSYIIETPIT